MSAATLHTIAGAVEPLVLEVEQRTSAEVVVVVSGSSSTYAHVTGWTVAAVALAATAFLCWSPWVFNDFWLPVDVATVSAVVAGLMATAPRTRLMLAGGAERERCVALAAQAAFSEEAVYATRARTGVLVYVSVLERTVLLRADTGVQRHVPAAQWNAIAAGFRDLSTNEAFATHFKELGALLAEHLPRGEDDIDESPNAPRVRT
jgi:putative membrane protein